MLAADIRGLQPGLLLFQHPDDQLFAEPTRPITPRLDNERRQVAMVEIPGGQITPATAIKVF